MWTPLKLEWSHAAMLPSRARAQHVNDPANHPAVIDTVRTAPPPWKQRLDP